MKPINYVVLAALKLKKPAGKHQKTNKAKRRLEKVKFLKDQP